MFKGNLLNKEVFWGISSPLVDLVSLGTSFREIYGYLA